MATARHSVTPDHPAQDDLRPIYLANLRQRFKGMLNRMSAHDMAQRVSTEPDADDLVFLLSYLHAWHWLRHEIPETDRAEVLAPFIRSRQGFLMQMLLASSDARAFLRTYIDHWRHSPPDGPIQREQCLRLLNHAADDVEALIDRLLSIWRPLDPFTHSYKIAYRELARDERERYDGMLGAEDQQRLALVDALPTATPPTQEKFSKLGLIPAMGCPQTCRHCMFIFRPLMKDTPDPQGLLEKVNALTDSVLFTGGDLTRQLGDFYRAIASMNRVSTFAILLNGDFADDLDRTREVLENMAKAVRRRPAHWPRAKVMLQISFDEFHQEIITDKRGRLKERIPIAKIANIVETAPRFGDEIQLCLLHKQHALNFSMDLFKKGVFARLVNELAARDHRVEVLSAAPSKRAKRNPLQPGQAAAPVVKDASFVLNRYPHTPILFTSSTIDAYGRGTLIDANEAVNERDLLQQLLNGQGAGGEQFDIDLMFWFNGWATLFSAVHMCLGNVYDDGMETILQRQRKDPLSLAMQRFDLRLLDFYRERADDLDAIIAYSTSPHHLFHSLTEDPAMRLHLTQRLIDDTP